MEGEKEFRSFAELPGGTPKRESHKKEKVDKAQLGGLLLQQMGLQVEGDEKIDPIDFLVEAVEAGWRNNPNRRAGDAVCWGPTIEDAFAIYFGNTQRFERVLSDAMRSGRISHLAEKSGKGYMLKALRQE